MQLQLRRAMRMNFLLHRISCSNTVISQNQIIRRQSPFAIKSRAHVPLKLRRDLLFAPLKSEWPLLQRAHKRWKILRELNEKLQSEQYPVVVLVHVELLSHRQLLRQLMKRSFISNVLLQRLQLSAHALKPIALSEKARRLQSAHATVN